MMRHGEWLQTATGRQFWPLDPRPEDVCIEDIAHTLALLCRFGGHCLEFYSVAQHSVLVSDQCEPEHALWGLLHDAAEAYLVDVPRPIKHAPEMLPYVEAEKAIQRAVAEHFGLPMTIHPSVKVADDVLLATEARDLMAPAPACWGLNAAPLETPVVPWSPWEAKSRFMDRFQQLMDARGAAIASAGRHGR